MLDKERTMDWMRDPHFHQPNNAQQAHLMLNLCSRLSPSFLVWQVVLYTGKIRLKFKGMNTKTLSILLLAYKIEASYRKERK